MSLFTAYEQITRKVRNIPAALHPHYQEAHAHKSVKSYMSWLNGSVKTEGMKEHNGHFFYGIDAFKASLCKRFFDIAPRTFDDDVAITME